MQPRQMALLPVRPLVYSRRGTSLASAVAIRWGDSDVLTPGMGGGALALLSRSRDVVLGPDDTFGSPWCFTNTNAWASAPEILSMCVCVSVNGKIHIFLSASTDLKNP